MIGIYTLFSLYFSVVSNQEIIYQNIQQIQHKIQEEQVTHIETPQKVKSLYYTATAINNTGKRNNLLYLARNKEINSVTIDIKTVSGYINFEMPTRNFGKIQPITNNSIKNIKKLLRELHKQNIYTIGRVVVFKDKLLADKRPDLAIQWSDRKSVWSDYKGNKYMDPSAQEVWDYNANIAKTAYEMGFDEINFDYVRFPTDGKVHDTYYPFSNKIRSDNPKWGNIIVIDKFSNYITQKIRETTPELKISADVFGLITNSDLFQIGQNLESFLLYFDYIGPMIYPSHYGQGFLGYKQPDNNPYEIFQYALNAANKRVDTLNNEILLAQSENRKINIRGNFEADKNINNIAQIEKIKIRPWIQGFSCAWCKGATPYNREKFRKQINSLEASGLNSWWVWSAGSNYYPNRYNIKD